MRVLLADDDPGNQRLAVAILEHRGHEVVVANSGREALAAFRRGGFHIVLLGVQLSDMDGLEATAAIRLVERGSGSGGHIPIVAMAAHSTKEDWDRCIAVGMDDCFVAPTHPDALVGVVERLGAGGPPRTAYRKAESVPWLLGDRAGLLRRFGGDAALVRQLISLFLGAAPPRLSEIRDAVATGDARRLERAAHTLRGSIVTFGAAAAAEVAELLELMGHNGAFGGAAETLAALEREVDRLGHSLGAILQQGDW